MLLFLCFSERIWYIILNITQNMSIVKIKCTPFVLGVHFYQYGLMLVGYEYTLSIPAKYLRISNASEMLEF